VNAASTEKQTVFVVDDDRAIQNAMCLLLQSVDRDYEVFASGDEFLEKMPADPVGCLVLDARMPSLGGLELQEVVNERGSTLPIILITGHGDVPMAVEAMQKGAVDFIQKPFRDQELLDCISEAFVSDQLQRDTRTQKTEIARGIGKLTKRERQVMDLVVTGKPNKVMAYELGVSQRTVEIHRARVMEKIGARSLADLVRMHLSR